MSSLRVEHSLLPFKFNFARGDILRMAPHAPEDDGWTIVGRVRSKGVEKDGRGPIAQKMALQPKREAPPVLNGWGGVTDFYGQGTKLSRKGSGKKIRQNSLGAKDEVSRLLEKVEGAR